MTLVKGGVPINFVNIGNMHFCEGKKQIHKTVSVDHNDIEAFRQLNQLGIPCEIRRVPDETGENITNLLN